MKKLALAMVMASVVAPAVAPDAAFARDHYYRGRNGEYYRHCKRSSGTTGLIAGGVGGGILGSALGGGTIGTLVGAGGGALLGRHLDKKHDAAQNRRNGC